MAHAELNSGFQGSKQGPRQPGPRSLTSGPGKVQDHRNVMKAEIWAVFLPCVPRALTYNRERDFSEILFSEILRSGCVRGEALNLVAECLVQRWRC